MCAFVLSEITLSTRCVASTREQTSGSNPSNFREQDNHTVGVIWMRSGQKERGITMNTVPMFSSSCLPGTRSHKLTILKHLDDTPHPNERENLLDGQKRRSSYVYAANSQISHVSSDMWLVAFPILIDCNGLWPNRLSSYPLD